MQLDLLGFTSATQRFATAAQAAAATALDFTLGSVMRALAEANAAVGLWIQWQILQVRSMTRLSTSTGDDIDSFVGDFGLVRLPGAAATGQVVVSRYAATQPALVLPGVLVRTADGTATVAIAADTDNPYWSTAAGASPGYLVPAGVASASLPAIATATGQVGNVGTGTLLLLATAVPGIDTVTNPAPFSGGLDAESDAALQARFRDFIAALSQATVPAITYAARSLQQGLAVQVVEPAPGAGYVTLYVDDGTGVPSQDLLSRVAQAVEPVRPIGLRIMVLAPTIVPVSISVIMIYPAGASAQDAEPLITAAVASYIGNLSMGQSLSFAKLTQIVLDAAPDGSDVSSLLLNSATATVAAGPGQRVHLGALSVA